LYENCLLLTKNDLEVIMKKFYILITAMILLSGARAQWTEQNSGTTNNLRAVHFRDTFHGFAVGDSGTIVKTNDGGENWISMVSGTNEQLNTLYCVNENCCFAAGSRSTPLSDTISTILKSTDGGYTWYNNSIGTVATNHQSIYFINEDVGYSVGSFSFWGGGSSTQYKTTNGGLTWNGMPNVSGGWGSKVAFLDADTGYILTGTDVGFGTFRSDIFKTTDGGATWSLNAQFPIWISDVCFVNSLIGYAIDVWGNVFKIIEGGGTVQLTSGSYMGSSIFFNDANTGYVAGGVIQKTTDGGITWTGQNIVASFVYFPVPDTGYAVGDGGKIFKTINGGGLPTGIYEPGKVQSSSTSWKITVLTYPNPFSDFTTIEYELEHPAYINLSIYSHLGQLVVVLADGGQSVGKQQVRWEADGIPAGIYFYRLTTNEQRPATGKLVLK
jgi:photosystem II stability/assembly factor-like uncharacterized protein